MLETGINKEILFTELVYVEDPSINDTFTTHAFF